MTIFRGEEGAGVNGGHKEQVIKESEEVKQERRRRIKGGRVFVFLVC